MSHQVAYKALAVLFVSSLALTGLWRWNTMELVLVCDLFADESLARHLTSRNVCFHVSVERHHMSAFEIKTTTLHSAKLRLDTDRCWCWQRPNLDQWCQTQLSLRLIVWGNFPADHMVLPGKFIYIFLFAIFRSFLFSPQAFYIYLWAWKLHFTVQVKLSEKVSQPNL